MTISIAVPHSPAVSGTGIGNAATASAACMAFGLDFYGQLAATPEFAAAKDKNVVLSPLSLASVLEVIRLGTVNTAQQELSTALYADQLTPGSPLGIPSFDNSNCPGVTLSSANSLWFDTHFLLKPGFVQAVQDEFVQDSLFQTDFSSSAAAAATINQWISANTGGHINNLVGEADIPFNNLAQTQLVIANAAYFKGKWAKQFEKNATQNSPFQLVSGTTVQVPTMHASGTYRYAVVDGIAILELPYQGNSVSMILLLPVEGGPSGQSGQFNPGSVLFSGSLGFQLAPANLSNANAQASLSGTGANTPPVTTAEALNNLETLLQGNWLDQAVPKLASQEVDVALPRFEFGCQPANTVDILKALGIERIFERSQDFAGMSDLQLQVGVVKHKAWLQVTEEGTEATAATIAGVMQTCAAVMKPYFSADHPFIFVIRHNATGMPLFIGRVSNPLSKE